MEQPTAPIGKRSYYSAKKSEKVENPRSGLERWRPMFEIEVEVREEVGDVDEMEPQEKPKWKVRQRRGWDGEGVGSWAPGWLGVQAVTHCSF